MNLFTKITITAAVMEFLLYAGLQILSLMGNRPMKFEGLPWGLLIFGYIGCWAVSYLILTEETE